MAYTFREGASRDETAYRQDYQHSLSNSGVSEAREESVTRWRILMRRGARRTTGANTPREDHASADPEGVHFLAGRRRPGAHPGPPGPGTAGGRVRRIGRAAAGSLGTRTAARHRTLPRTDHAALALRHRHLHPLVPARHPPAGAIRAGGWHALRFGDGMGVRGCGAILSRDR